MTDTTTHNDGELAEPTTFPFRGFRITAHPTWPLVDVSDAAFDAVRTAKPRWDDAKVCDVAEGILDDLIGAGYLQ